MLTIKPRVSNSINPGNPAYSVLYNGRKVGCVWYGAGGYWYTHNRMSDTVGHNPPAEFEVKSLEHLAQWVYEQWKEAGESPTVTIETSFDCTQREVVLDIARIIYKTHDCKLPDDLMYLYNSQHPTERAVLQAAEDIFEMFFGDTPSYDDDDLEEADEQT